ncbi:cytokinin dehydrogenase 11 [Favolaschia claudopus]|uniref:Cytokinin dehydrogenase 11 n=1 Tax=Favolaschia claudopus TaxID=2862362 RepID=A0AAV9ZIZ4_9AGAR
MLPTNFPALPQGLSAPAFNVTSAAIQASFNDLFASVDSRIFSGIPLAYPCFASTTKNGAECGEVQRQYLNETFRAANFGASIETQWEICQRTGAQCLLDSSNPTARVAQSGTCDAGSVSSYFIDVRNAADVIAAFKFSSQTSIPLVVKNTGHDYKGRSSAPNSLALWTHNLKNMSYQPAFVPERCPKNHLSQPAATFGAGVQWAEAYEFADVHNITLVGGTDRSVGVVGGWLQGGGHSVLSNTMGLGVDRVLQFKVVTPDGIFRVANACENEDLFFALRGGGGGTFGVVLEATLLASPAVTLQAVIVSWASSNRTLTGQLWSVMVDNALTWAADGWGGFSTSELAILVNPILNSTEAEKSLESLINFGNVEVHGNKVPGAQVVVTSFPSFLSFFNEFTSEHVASVGTNLAIASRLIDKSTFSTESNRTALVSGLQRMNDAGPGMIILLTTPFSYLSAPAERTSVTEAWRSSVYHVTAIAEWPWDASADDKRAAYRQVSTAVDNMREITPDAAYQNEADVYEPNHEVAFWGSHYAELWRIKQKYDPQHLLDCWHCVGWNPESSRFSCYL